MSVRLADGGRVVLHVDGRAHWIGDIEIDDSIHAHGHVVAGDAVLGRTGIVMICM